MKKLMMTIVAAGLALAALADPATYYVDPTNGVDNAEHDGTTWATAKKTLVEVMKLAADGDTVYAAEGVYDAGVAEDAALSTKMTSYFRVIVPAGVALVATGACERTIIKGANATVNLNGGCGTDSLSCVRLKGTARVEGFTIRDGRASMLSTAAYIQGGGVAADSTSKVVDCRILACHAYRAGAGAGGVWVRCYFANNTYGQIICGLYNSVCYNCVMDTHVSYFMWMGALYNCTFLPTCNAAYRDINSTPHGDVVNCLILSPYINDQGGVYKNCVFGPNSKFGKTQNYSTNEFCRTAASWDEVRLDAAYMPQFDSIARGAADAALLPAAYSDLDFHGKPRIVRDQLDAGAVAFDYTRIVNVQTVEGISYSGVDVGANKKVVPFAFAVTRGAVKRPVPGVTTNGVEVLFGDSDTLSFEITEVGTTIDIAPIHVPNVTWYVDEKRGTDKNPTGFKPGADAYASLQAAMANPQLESGDVVSVAEGIYSNGVATVHDANNNYDSFYRVSVPAGVKLVASGTRSATVIVGKRAKSPDMHGCGVDSVACVHLAAADSVVQGFTLRGGYATISGGNYRHGGGVSAGSGKVVDCDVIDCHAERGGAGGDGIWIRCYFAQNEAGIGEGFYSGAVLYNCVINNACTDYFACNATFHHCTVMAATVEAMRGLSSSCQMYNCLVQSARIFGYGAAGSANRCAILATATIGTTPGAKTNDCIYASSLAGLAVDPMWYIPAQGTVVIDAADESRTTFPAGYADTDFNGMPRRVGSVRDIGAVEYDPNFGYAVVTDPKKGLVVTGLPDGRGLISPPQTLHITVGRNYDVTPIASGFTVNGEFVSFEGKPDDWTAEYTVTGAADSIVIEPVFPAHSTWYVNRHAADDADATQDGKTETRAVRTLAKVMTLAQSGDTVVALPGVYDELDMGTVGSAKTLNRAIVPDGVTLTARDGAAVTEICGALAPEPVKDGCGEGAMRPLYAKGNNVISGFTIANGRVYATSASSGEAPGGAVNGADVVYQDCVFTNNAAIYRGGATAGGTFNRCKFFYNRCYGGQGSSINSWAYAYDCVFDHDKGCGCHAVYCDSRAGRIVNCTFGADLDSAVREPKNGATCETRILNSILLCKTAQGCCYTNCVMVKASSNGLVDPETVIVTNAAAIALDAQYRPTRVAEFVIDAGNDAFRPATAGAEDAYGNQRVYNGTVDIGATEYDWRGDFAKKLGKRVEVPAADPMVTLQAGGVSVAAGNALTFRVTLAAQGGNVTFKAGGTVTVDGQELVPGAGGVYSFAGLAHMSYDVTVKATDGAVTVLDVKVPKNGMLFLAR